MHTAYIEATNSLSFRSAQSDTKLVLNVVARSKSISIPKLAAKTKFSTEELNSILHNLLDEGIVQVRTDELGFKHIELAQRVLRYCEGMEKWVF
jgi:DNA-binding IclR family transcriptional regulator